MKFQSYDLGNRASGDTVRVTLSGSAANVCLMDSGNFQNYRSGHEFRYTGGYKTHSPVSLQVPHAGHWYVTIDLGGHVGSVRSSIQVFEATAARG